MAVTALVEGGLSTTRSTGEGGGKRKEGKGKKGKK
jgi:hypothetical protein